MVFSSLPLYHLDPPSWNQPNQPPPSNESPHLLSPPLPPSMILSSQQPTQNQSNTGGNGGASRPGSMAERARLAKIPQPEPALKCPRCDSTNTKFCYFNNYSLSQPRHFCKTCRRYWTRGGALRNVPVGGGCRRNKRSSNKSSSSKSGGVGAGGGGGGGGASSSAAAAASSSSSCSTATSGSTVIPSNFVSHHQLPFLGSLADQYSAAAAAAANLGLSFSSLHHHQQQQQLDAGDYGNSSINGLDQWRIQQIQQFPFLGGLDPSSSAAHINGIYPNFDAEGFHQMPSKGLSSTTASGLITQLASVKMEDNQPQAALSLPRQYLGIPGNDQYLGGGWPGDLSGFNSSSGNLL